MCAPASPELATPPADAATPTDDEAARAAAKQSLHAKLGADWARVFGRNAQRKLGAVAKPPSSWHLNPPETYYPLLEATPFWQTPSHSSRVQEAVDLLERFHPVILAELQGLRESALNQYRQAAGTEGRELSVDGLTTLLHDKGDWRVHYLQLEGSDTAESCRLTPKTAKIVRSISRAAGHALFSVLDPGTHILPHCGPCNHKLRLHLGLVIPDGRCCIRVGDQERSWSEGKVLVMDDAFEHEVWNDTQAQRVVLIVDIWHPDFSNAEVTYLEETRAARRRRVDGREGAMGASDAPSGAIDAK
tara:strand:+ start:265 stop:1173 length:909 start_codon:yes stop_codon:yes gene_type:complete